ncbi:MAG: ferrous iron transport protein A [Spirochaetaceae bacterium]|jgi:ferrous iron transport protein A|nr:ferrous iron transport protein A [Spirochaetaceae bacterium]
MILSKLKPGAGFVVLGVKLEREVGRRLADMGFIQGTRGFIIRRELFGGPIEVQILGYKILLRRSEADGIEVKENKHGDALEFPPEPQGEACD